SVMRCSRTSRPLSRASSTTRRRVTPGRMRPSAAGVATSSPYTAKRLPRKRPVETTRRLVEELAIGPLVRAEAARDGEMSERDRVLPARKHVGRLDRGGDDVELEPGGRRGRGEPQATELDALGRGSDQRARRRRQRLAVQLLEARRE